ncbi:hypothetical protein A9Q74_06245 [Colwellia sp. 39_35_sub15_T18]|nr:hypothetical protein A9Q74_06245 [Colwellia sp. 39_35_sub15_T18]
MAKIKAFTAGEKRVFHKLALAMIAAEIESQVIKPATEKETGKPYQSKGGYLDIYLKSDPTVKRVWNAFQKEVQKVRSDYLKYAEAEKANEGT